MINVINVIGKKLAKVLKLTLLTLIFGFVFGFLNLREVFAQTYDNYIWQYLVPQNISGVDDLKLKLEQEVQKIINSGHLAPFRALYGESQSHFFWYRPYDVVYTLSLSYPYLNSSLKDGVKNYLRTEMQNYPIWYSNPNYLNSAILNPDEGTKREPDLLPSGLRVREYPAWGLRGRPQLFGLYALWLYAQNTGDWNYIESNWNQIKDFYNSYRSETSRYYSSIAGAIGVARMARQKPTPDLNFENSVLSDINTGFSNGLNFVQFGRNAESVYLWSSDAVFRARMLEEAYLGFVFLDISPEIGRFMYDNQALRESILGISNPSEYSLTRGEYVFPLWYMVQSPMGSFYFDEGTGNPPDTRAMIFPIHAWIKKDSPSQLRRYLDVPDALIGDFYYIQNLVRTIEAHGQENWCDVRSGGCPVPTPIPAVCSLTSAFWNTSGPVNVGTSVTLTVIGENCDGKEVSFEVREDDGVLGYDPVNTNPSNARFAGNTATSTWVSEYQPDCGGLCDPPEYYFRATLVENQNIFINSSNILTVNPLPTPTPVPTLTPTPTPTLTSTPRPTSTPTPTPTRVATPTPTPTPRPTSTPIITFSPAPTMTPTPTFTPTPTPVPCTLVSANWETTNAVLEGTQVALRVTASGNCAGRVVEYQIWEDDGILGRDPVKVNPSSSAIISGSSTSNWVAEYQPDGLFGIADPPEYYFEARLNGESNFITSSQPLLEVSANPNNLTIASLPIISISTTSATISWYTNIPSTSQVIYGIPGKRQKTTSEFDTNPMLTYHSVEIANLKPCATYEFTMRSSNSSIVVESPVYQLTTLGCRGNSPIKAQTSSLISSSTGGSLTLEISSSITLNVSPNFADLEDASFQIKQLDSNSVFSESPIPSGYLVFDDFVFNIIAMIGSDDIDTLENFLAPLSIEIRYSDTSFNNLDESSLKIFRYEDSKGEWQKLEDCTKNSQENILSCNVSNLSDFAVFAMEKLPTPTPTQPPAGTGSTGSTGGTGGTGGGEAAPPQGQPSIVGDLNSDGKVNIFDLSILLSNYGRSGRGDLNSDGKVDIFDLSILLSRYGR